MARRRDDAQTPSTQASAAYLRAQFFARKLGELGFFGILDRMRELARESAELSWDEHEDFGITSDAMDLVRDSGVGLVRVFLHPDLLQQDPSIVFYYRCIGLLGRKNVYALAGTDISGLERGNRSSVSRERALRIAKAVNSTLSLLVESVQPFGEEQIQAFLIASAGITLQGSWVNEIGKQGELLVKGIVVRGLWQHVTEAQRSCQEVIRKRDRSQPGRQDNPRGKLHHGRASASDRSGRPVRPQVPHVGLGQPSAVAPALHQPPCRGFQVAQASVGTPCQPRASAPQNVFPKSRSCGNGLAPGMSMRGRARRAARPFSRAARRAL